jgi:hypothetical protein
MATKTLREANHHHLHKSNGDTKYTGPLEPATLYDEPDLESRMAAMHRDGFTVFPGVLDAAQVAELRAIMDAAGGDDSQYDVPKWCFNKHVGARYHQMPELIPYVDPPGVIETVQGTMGSDAQVIGGSMWITGPGRQMGLHLDYQPIALPEDVAADPRVTIPIFIATAHYYLDDMYLELGPTTLIPGSHRAGRAPDNETDWNGVTPKALLVNAGDVMLFRSDIWHGAALNSSQQRRYMVQVHYGNVYIQRQFPPITMADQWSAESLARVSARQRVLFGDNPDQKRGSYIKERRVLPPRGRR